ncbi:MAG: AAA family ATPase [Chloroflexota bacterium]|nr:AAA family ATPase [Chloroflexota bacterium]
MAAETAGEIIILGVCAAGKSTLARRLRETGRRARTVAQEHSCIPDLWRWSGAATVIYLHASYQAVRHRRHTLTGPRGYDVQLQRLRSARAGATLTVDTSNLTPEEVYRIVDAQLTQDPNDPRPAPMPIADEPGSDVQPRPHAPSSVPVPDEPGDEQRPGRYEGLPIPEEL